MKILTNKQIDNLLNYRDFLDDEDLEKVMKINNGVPIGTFIETESFIYKIDVCKRYADYINSIIRKKLKN